MTWVAGICYTEIDSSLITIRKPYKFPPLSKIPLSW